MKLFRTGQRVFHEVYGAGTVIEPIVRGYAIKFDNGGPQGWAERSNHEPDELEVIQ